jgi:hypothetical protein
MLFVDNFALGAAVAAKAASNCDSYRNSYSQPDRNMAGEDAGSRTNASTQCEAESDLRRRFFHARLPLRTADSSRTEVRSE